MARISLDTNILVYAVDGSTGSKNDRARELLRGAALSDAVITQQVIGEFLNVSRKMAHLNQRRLRRIAVGLCATFTIATTPRDMLFEAFDLAHRAGLQFWDAVIVSVCLGNAVDVLISEDMQDGQSVDGLTILNPFNAANIDRLSTLPGTTPD